MGLLPRSWRVLVVVGVILGASAAVQTGVPQQPAEEKLVLPQPEKSAGMSLNEALARRRSVRAFSARPLTQQELGQLLWAAQGITSNDGKRTAPSAGARYPLELYVATPAGLFHYLPAGHQLERRVAGDIRPALSRAAGGQSSVAEAGAVFVIAAASQRTAQRYGPERSPRFVQLEAGHVAQNLLLQAVALGLAGVPVGAADDAQVRSVVQLPQGEDAVYMVVIGHPR